MNKEGWDTCDGVMLRRESWFVSQGLAPESLVNHLTALNTYISRDTTNRAGAAEAFFELVWHETSEDGIDIEGRLVWG
jgi:hypothetical protein